MAQSENSTVGVLGVKGRNAYDPTLLIPDTQCLEALNVDFFQCGLGRKRGGSSSLSLATSGTAFANGIAAMGRFVPGFDQTLAEFWALDFSKNFHRLAGSVTWADPTVLDACSATPQEAVFLPFNGKLYVAYKSAHNRLHVWDGSTLRRCGLDMPAAPTAVLASGAITDTRKYRVAWTKQVSGVTTYRSNLGTASASQALSAQQATMTKPTAPGEGETHWELYGASTSSSFGDYRLIGTATIATASIVDNAALPSTVAPADGQNTPPPSARYMVADDARVIMAGAYEASTNAENAMTPSVSRVWWTAVLGAATGDDERISNTGTINAYADLEEAITGISQPMQAVSSQANSLERGSFYVFSYESQWKFISTGDATTPYLKFRITGGGGCIHHKSILTAIDVNGNPAVYWWSQDGPYRIGVDGQQFLGLDIQDIINSVNLDATIPVHSVFYRSLHQVWFFVATGSSLYPNQRVVFDTKLGQVTQVDGVRMGWSLHTGENAKAYCSCMFSDTVAASMGKKLKPYIGYSGGNAIWKCDTSDADDAGTPYQAYVDSKSYAPWGLGNLGGSVGEAYVLASPSAGVTVKLTIYVNEGASSLISTVDLTDTSDSQSATRLLKKFDNSKFADSFSFRCRVGDAQAIANSWTLDGVVVPVTVQGDV